jgi:hypothetical protein
MPCYHPIEGWRSRKINKDTGKRSIVFKRVDGFIDMPVKVPCGRCIGCRLERSRQWAMRCVHESQLYEKNCFITLTFNDEHLPKSGSISKRDMQLFMKRLRKEYPDETIRFFGCGEYGDKRGRPHYHICLFNFDFPDRVFFRVKNGFALYRSSSLERLWPFGFTLIGDVTFESAAYVARYVTKKITGSKADEVYKEIDYSTGEVLNELVPEFCLMSRGSRKRGTKGLGSGWLDKFSSDIYNHDYVILNGKKLRPPKYYDSRFEVEHPDEFLGIKGRRVRNALILERDGDNSLDRLKVKKTIQKRKFQLLLRSYENE